ncbi:hypothetical protein Ctob_016443 [Chrysochromulina tobinii]|uniref:Uncharacterized protein n=1 Tax=Chrysochromulina tobinii TaxID=1460289 RepID=A0A0M0KSU1_9EUKA|nr:hypothetical protein Ctob_016443 [Chrysochromulina tobinii]|eukprot:KOO41899.1 hypothetical protein Ctob_016443 [Chrysochromulina sp. CCMP291]
MQRRRPRSAAHGFLKKEFVSVYSPIGNRDGNLEGTPAYLPGSPHHPGGILKGGKAAGGYYGDDDWCSTKLRQTLEHKIATAGRCAQS